MPYAIQPAPAGHFFRGSSYAAGMELAYFHNGSIAGPSQVVALVALLSHILGCGHLLSA